jgi:hypothetical protein
VLAAVRNPETVGKSGADSGIFTTGCFNQDLTCAAVSSAVIGWRKARVLVLTRRTPWGIHGVLEDKMVNPEKSTTSSEVTLSAET